MPLLGESEIEVNGSKLSAPLTPGAGTSVQSKRRYLLTELYGLETV